VTVLDGTDVVTVTPGGVLPGRPASGFEVHLESFEGPALVQEHGTTTTLFTGDRCRVAATGELVIEVANA